jgi:very-short-patch-repair endonuclease
MNKKHLPFDFCIPEKKVIIELDGPQHFIQVSNWKSPEKCFETDVFKQRCANENGYSVVRIIQDDVWFDRYDWLAKLQETLENIGDRENVFLYQNHEYDTLQSALIQAC